MGTWIVWGAGFIVATILFLLAAPPGFRLSAKGLFLTALLLALMAGCSLLHVRQLRRMLEEQPLGPPAP